MFRENLQAPYKSCCKLQRPTQDFQLAIPSPIKHQHSQTKRITTTTLTVNNYEKHFTLDIKYISSL